MRANSHSYIVCDGYHYPVYSHTVGQYIGAKDRDGNKIFEGDILRWDNVFCYEVVSKPMGWELVDKKFKSEPPQPSFLFVNGNIHDNQ